MPVRVLMCGSIPPEWGGATGGGVASFHRTLIEELLCPGSAGDLDVIGVLPFNLRNFDSYRGPVPLIRPPADRAAEAGFYARMLADLDVDVVLFQHIGNRWAAYHGELCEPPPAIGVIHSWHGMTFRQGDAADRIRRLVTRALPGCDRLVFVARCSIDEGRTLGFQYPNAPVVINNPFGSSFISEPETLSTRREGWVCLGALDKRKNPEAALAAAARCKAWITFVGRGPEEDPLRATASRLGIEDRVRFTGWLEPEDIRDLLLRSELLCNPSQSEGFSVAYVEALACGVPVVGAAANLAELAERMGFQCGAGVREGTADEVTALARAVRDRPWDRAELRSRAMELFSPAAVASKYTALVRDLVS